MPAARALPILRAPNAGVAQLVEQSLRKREVGGSSPSTGTNIPEPRFWRAVQLLPLWARLALAVASASAFWWVMVLDTRLEWSSTVFGEFNGPSHLIAAIFGLLVMAPYAAASSLRWPRILAMCVASAAIYFYAVKFVIDGPFSYNTITPFLISGGGAAVLVGVSVALLAPRRLSWQLPVLCLMAGVIGGAAFDNTVWTGSDFRFISGHWPWQVLVCLALHLGLRPAPA